MWDQYVSRSLEVIFCSLTVKPEILQICSISQQIGWKSNQVFISIKAVITCNNLQSLCNYNLIPIPPLVHWHIITPPTYKTGLIISPWHLFLSHLETFKWVSWETNTDNSTFLKKMEGCTKQTTIGYTIVSGSSGFFKEVAVVTNISIKSGRLSGSVRSSIARFKNRPGTIT